MSKSLEEIDGNLNEEDSSGYLTEEDGAEQLDFGGLFSSQFSNIRLMYSSSSGPTEIYTATRYGRRYMLKGLKKQYLDDPIYNLGLVKEFEIGILLDHPNIRRTLGLEVVEGVGKVIVLEHIDGSTLQSLMDSGAVTQSSAREIVGQLAGALSYIHSKQIFHRDIKPSNIVVSHQGGVVKLIDFNLSDSDDFIVLKNPAGSRKYMAPEQLTSGVKPSAAADIYSFGVVMNELASLTGDEQLAQPAVRCMHNNPAKRPASVDRIKLPVAHPSFTQAVSAFIASKTLTYVLLGVCAVLAAVIVYGLFDFNR